MRELSRTIHSGLQLVVLTVAILSVVTPAVSVAYLFVEPGISAKK